MEVEREEELDRWKRNWGDNINLYFIIKVVSITIKNTQLNRILKDPILSRKFVIKSNKPKPVHFS